VSDTGLVSCWGRGRDGQLGRGGTVDGGDFSDPNPGLVGLQAGQLARSITSTDDATFALLDDGTVWGWGLVSRNPRIIETSPVKIDLPKRATQIEAGHGHACAVLDGGELWCWGENGMGELGRGIVTYDGGLPERVMFP
jgi:alpha-tubulin suppressor-like RCC1 family protein